MIFQARPHREAVTMGQAEPKVRGQAGEKKTITLARAREMELEEANGGARCRRW
jgi:hypothetical protein